MSSSLGTRKSSHNVELTRNWCKLIHFVFIHIKNADPAGDGIILCISFLNTLLNPVEKLVRVLVKFLCFLGSGLNQTTQVPFAELEDPDWITQKVIRQFSFTYGSTADFSMETYLDALHSPLQKGSRGRSLLSTLEVSNSPNHRFPTKIKIHRSNEKNQILVQNLHYFHPVLRPPLPRW